MTFVHEVWADTWPEEVHVATFFDRSDAVRFAVAVNDEVEAELCSVSTVTLEFAKWKETAK